jgi:serine phosphatase RsbU (regulator of sigma subunit)
LSSGKEQVQSLAFKTANKAEMITRLNDSMRAFSCGTKEQDDLTAVVSKRL